MCKTLNAFPSTLHFTARAVGTLLSEELSMRQ